MSAALEVSELTVGYEDRDREEPNVVVSGVSLALQPGRILGLAGESGCGKSTAALTAIGYRVPGSVRLSGSARCDGVDLLEASPAQLRELWGKRIAYVAQDASLALNPLHRVERLLRDPIELHLGLEGNEAREHAVGMLARVGIPEPERALRRFPFQFSGGQQQRIALAIALACRPAVLVLDEPTTGLDVTTQAQISELVRQLVAETGTAALAISHDLALLATICDEIAIMYAGEIVERAPAAPLYAAPRHPYAAALIDAAPHVDDPTPMLGIPGLPPPEAVTAACAFAPRCRHAIDACATTHPTLSVVAAGHEVACIRSGELGGIASARAGAPLAEAAPPARELLRVDEVRCSYPGARGAAAVDGVSLVLAEGETLALVGESGSGKSTLLRAVAGLHVPDGGTIAFGGALLASRVVRRPRELRRAIQLVFQNPHASLNPRHTIRAAVERPLALFRPELSRAARAQRVRELLASVRLDEILLDRYPAQLSGGQKQRVALARAFAADPALILCDEVVSALDVSVQAVILELLGGLARERGTALLFVTHDLAVVRSIADNVCVMRDGVILERGPTERVFREPADAYTRELLAAVPRPTRRDGTGGQL